LRISIHELTASSGTGCWCGLRLVQQNALLRILSKCFQESMMMKNEVKEFVGAFIPASLNERLEEIARAEERSKSQVIKRLLERALQTPQQ
jgi:hypothetical protein